MKKVSTTFVLLILSFIGFSQQKVSFVIHQLPDYNNSDSIYIASSFNNWNPRHPFFLLKKDNGTFGITIDLSKGMYAYKFTSGGWDKVETTADGSAVDNRLVRVEKDTTIVVDIQGWADHFPKKTVVSSASKNVQILDSSFYIPQLNRHRRIWLYLPSSYHTSGKHYPVLYLHDGQNVFDNATSYAGEWGVDETIDSMGKQYGEMIVVAIDNGGDKRLNEYSPYDHPNYGKGEGDAYVDFLVQTLMPYINRNFRTRTDSKNNYIAGSSMGGLISLYAVLKYPEKFGAAGVFSPAFWFVPKMKTLTKEVAHKLKNRIYFFAGELESDQMVPDMKSYYEILKKYSKADLHIDVNPQGKHDEKTWREQFPDFYKWLQQKQ